MGFLGISRGEKGGEEVYIFLVDFRVFLFFVFRYRKMKERLGFTEIRK